MFGGMDGVCGDSQFYRSVPAQSQLSSHKNKLQSTRDWGPVAKYLSSLLTSLLIKNILTSKT